MFEFTRTPGSLFDDFDAALISVLVDQNLAFDSGSGHNELELRLGEFMPDRLRRRLADEVARHRRFRIDPLAQLFPILITVRRTAS